MVVTVIDFAYTLTVAVKKILMLLMKTIFFFFFVSTFVAVTGC